MRLPRLIVITDPALPLELLLSRLDAALSVGPSVAVQVRHPLADLEVLERLALDVIAVAGRYGNPVFLNGPASLAGKLGTHLHLRSDQRNAQRRHLAAGSWISAAVHREEDRPAEADLGLVSPVFSPGSKPRDDRPTLGVEGFRRLATKLPFPAYALGGIDVARARALEGAAGVAVISSVLHAADPRAAARALAEGEVSAPVG